MDRWNLHAFGQNYADQSRLRQGRPEMCGHKILERPSKPECGPRMVFGPSAVTVDSIACIGQHILRPTVAAGEREHLYVRPATTYLIEHGDQTALRTAPIETIDNICDPHEKYFPDKRKAQPAWSLPSALAVPKINSRPNDKNCPESGHFFWDVSKGDDTNAHRGHQLDIGHWRDQGR
jgi:hypothetical protein